MLLVVDNTDGLTQPAQAQADFGILSEAMLVPAPDTLNQIPPEKHGVTPKGDHTNLSMKVEPTLEPEKILHAVMDGKPMVAEVHELNASL